MLVLGFTIESAEFLIDMTSAARFEGVGGSRSVQPVLEGRTNCAAAGVLRFVPALNPSSLDSLWAQSAGTREAAFMVFDTLYGLDASLTPQPQMVEGHELSEDGLIWRFSLREGLRFHDGEPVLQTPVAITKNGRPHTVLMSAALFGVLVRGRIARPVEDLDDDTLKAIASSAVAPEFAALDQIIKDWSP
jgi:hypothetical protein